MRGIRKRRGGRKKARCEVAVERVAMLESKRSARILKDFAVIKTDIQPILSTENQLKELKPVLQRWVNSDVPGFPGSTLRSLLSKLEGVIRPLRNKR